MKTIHSVYRYEFAKKLAEKFAEPYQPSGIEFHVWDDLVIGSITIYVEMKRKFNLEHFVYRQNKLIADYKAKFPDHNIYFYIV